MFERHRRRASLRFGLSDIGRLLIEGCLMADARPNRDCEHFEQQLFELRDGRVDDATREHIAHCPRCRETADWDRRFAGTLRGEAIPSPATMPAIVRERMRSRRRLSAVAYATAASVVIASVLTNWRPWNLQQQTIVETRGTSPSRTDDLAELPMLFEPPPVDSLDVLTRQQNGYVVALRRLGDE